MLIPDLNWLPTSLFKGIEYPKVEWEKPNYNYGGYYKHNSKTLTIVHSEGTEHATIAHEFKHYLQELKGTLDPDPKGFTVETSYEEAIYKYFSQSITEYEALLFEYKYAKSWVNDWWLRKLVWEYDSSRTIR